MENLVPRTLYQPNPISCCKAFVLIITNQTKPAEDAGCRGPCACLPPPQLRRHSRPSAAGGVEGGAAAVSCMLHAGTIQIHLILYNILRHGN